jgi:hypothetical protein
MPAVDAVLFDLDQTVCTYERTADEALSDRYPLGVDPDPRPHHVVDTMHDVAAEPWV